MAALTKAEIEQLKKKLEEKQKEIKEICDQLIEAGAWPIDDDLLDTVAGGTRGGGNSIPIVSKGYRTDKQFV